MGAVQEATGCTRDISPNGSYVWATGCPPKDAAVNMNIYLPAGPGDNRAFCVEAVGRVVRTDAATKGSPSGGFSVQNQKLKLCPS